MVRNLSEIMDIYIKSGGWQAMKDLDNIFFHPYHPGIKADIDLTPFIGNNTIEKIEFGFYKNREFSVEIQLEDKISSTVRPLLRNQMRHKGSKIILEKEETKTVKNYFVTIRKEEYDEEDKSRKCQNYPIENFKSYAECDISFATAKYMENFRKRNCLNENETITPLFITKNLTEVTELKILNCTHNTYYDQDAQLDLFKGEEMMPCPPPCSTTQTNSLLTSIGQDDDASIIIAFDSSITIFRITVDRFEMMETLNFFGSNLGLWPGLGIFQIIEWIFENILEKCHVKNIMKSRN